MDRIGGGPWSFLRKNFTLSFSLISPWKLTFLWVVNVCHRTVFAATMTMSLWSDHCEISLWSNRHIYIMLKIVANISKSLLLSGLENHCSFSNGSHLTHCSIFPSIRVFSNESALCIRCPKYWSFSLNISPSNEHPGLISFRMDWFDLLAVQGTLKSFFQHRNSKASILQFSAFL